MIEKPTPAEPPKAKPVKPTELLAERVLTEMRRLAENGVAEFTSTLLRDKLGLDKESGCDQVRRAMKRLAKDGKVVVEKKAVKEKGARKQYVYTLKESGAS